MSVRAIFASFMAYLPATAAIIAAAADWNAYIVLMLATTGYVLVLTLALVLEQIASIASKKGAARGVRSAGDQ